MTELFRRHSLLVPGGCITAAETAQAQGGRQMTRIDLERASYKVGLTGFGPPPNWTVLGDSGRKVLAETSKDTADYRFPLAIFDQPVAADLDVAVRFKPVAGEVD